MKKSRSRTVGAIAAAFLLLAVSSNRAKAVLLPGDFNVDAHVDLQDSDACAFALVDPATYKAVHLLTDFQLLSIGDFNSDGQFNNRDINPFLQFLGAGGGPVNAQLPAMLYFSTSGTNPGATSPTNTATTNPNVTIGLGSSTTLYVWAQVNDLEAINGLGFGVRTTDGQVAAATSSQILNPTSGSGANTFLRWTAVNQGTLGPASPGPQELVSGANAVFVHGNYFGLDGANNTAVNGTYVAQAPNADGSGRTMVGSLLVGSITLLGNSLGTASLFLDTGLGTISYEQGLGGQNVQFGAGDPTINGAAVSMTSQLADATITVVPEPPTAVLAIVALLATRLARAVRYGQDHPRPRPPI